MKKSIQPQAILFPNPVLVVCTYDANGKPNAATLAWGGIASSQPPAISIAVQPRRYTYEAIVKRKAFTVNLVPEKYAAEADYFGIASGRESDKFAVTGLTPVKSEVVDAPYIAEFPYALECEIAHILDLGLHTLFIGEVKGTVVEDGAAAQWSDIISWDASTREYFAKGAPVAKAFSAGMRFTKSEPNQ